MILNFYNLIIIKMKFLFDRQPQIELYKVQNLFYGDYIQMELGHNYQKPWISQKLFLHLVKLNGIQLS